jgi:chemotaxis protein MotA
MPAGLVGLIFCTVATLFGTQMKGVNPVMLFTNFPALFIVMFGAIGATMASFEFPVTTGAIKAIMKALLGKGIDDAPEKIAILVDFARKARGEGLLALESEMSKLEDPFMKRGLQLAIDGSDPDAVSQVMKTDIKAMKARHKVYADWCMTFGIFAPTFGIIGAVVGLIAALGKLSQPEKLGAGIAAAFVATFLGVWLANGLMLPLANRMKRMSTEEVHLREMVMEGVLAIQGGQNPRVIEETLLSYLSPTEAAEIRGASS